MTYGQQAGAKAYNRSAFHETATWFDQALQGLSHLPETPDTPGLAMDLRLDLARPCKARWQSGRLAHPSPGG